MAAQSSAARGDAVSVPAALCLRLIAWYQARLSPHVEVECFYRPTCSEYTRLAIMKYGALRGAWRGWRRICRCRPGYGRGDDPP